MEGVKWFLEDTAEEFFKHIFQLESRWRNIHIQEELCIFDLEVNSPLKKLWIRELQVNILKNDLRYKKKVNIFYLDV